MDKDNIYANINSYINKENIMKYSIIVLSAGQKWCHPNADENYSEMTKKRVGSGYMKESKKYGYVCTCHASDLPQYNCVVFLRQNYNLNIPAVANTLSKWYREIWQKEIHMQTMSWRTERWQIQQERPKLS